MRHIIRLNVGKEIKSFSELFIDKIFEYTFVTFEYEQTINSRNLSPSPSKKIQMVGGKITENLRFEPLLRKVKNALSFYFSFSRLGIFNLNHFLISCSVI